MMTLKQKLVVMNTQSDSWLHSDFKIKDDMSLNIYKLVRRLSNNNKIKELVNGDSFNSEICSRWIHLS